jgi:2-methylisocitrate lyase-like PEP mutase family enzyme
MGFSVVLYANAVLQAALKATYDVLRALGRDGSLISVQDRLGRASTGRREARMGRSGSAVSRSKLD